MDQKNLARWTTIHLFPSTCFKPNLKQRSNLSHEWINIHLSTLYTFQLTPYLFSTVVTFNTDKLILGLDTETGWAGLSLTLIVFGVKEQLNESRVIPKTGWCARVDSFPIPHKMSLFLPLWRSPGGYASPPVLTPPSECIPVKPKPGSSAISPSFQLS